MKDFTHERAIASSVPEAGAPHPELSGYGQIKNAALPLRAALLPERLHGRYRAWGKRLFDVSAVILTLPLSAIVIAVMAVALWLEGGRPFYTQERLGRNGQRFRMLKLRTMVHDADALLEACLAADPALRLEWDVTQKLKNDPRITPLGALLRATSLDELPQVWNVLKGDMSLVGPRPMMPDQLPLYGDPRAYFALRPGVTGAWQVSARNERSFETRAPIDADYHTYVSLHEDMLILFQTVGVVLRRTGY